MKSNRFTSTATKSSRSDIEVVPLVKPVNKVVHLVDFESEKQNKLLKIKQTDLQNKRAIDKIKIQTQRSRQRDIKLKTYRNPLRQNQLSPYERNRAIVLQNYLSSRRPI